MFIRHSGRNTNTEKKYNTTKKTDSTGQTRREIVRTRDYSSWQVISSETIADNSEWYRLDTFFR